MATKSRILVVEDDPHVVIFVVDTLRFMEFEVSVARNGIDGLKKAREEKPDLLVLDVMMPGMDGYEVCRLLKTDPSTQHIPILMLTAKGQLDDKVKGFGIGADDYLAKPYEKAEFEARVKALLKRAALSIHAGETKIFLSYAQQDVAQVGELYDKLRTTGFTPWMDTKNILGGERWGTAIRRAIRASDFFIVCLSPRSTNKRGYMQKEIKIALEILDEMLDEDIYLIPTRLEACDVSHERLREYHWVDLFADDGFERLVRAIREGTKRRR